MTSWSDTVFINGVTRITIVFGCVLLFLTASALSCLAGPRPPNFVVILVDDQGWGTTSIAYDPNVPDSKSDFFLTPNLERLAKHGKRFTNAYAAHPNCSPSRAALLTGRTPAAMKFTDIIGRHRGAFYEGNRLIPAEHIPGLPQTEISLPEIIKTHYPKYKAAHFGKWHLANGGPRAHGFDAGDGATSNSPGDDKANWKGDPKRMFSITQRGNQWMKQQVDAGVPFYLQLSHYAVHLNYQYRPQTRQRFLSQPLGKRHQNVDFAAMLFDLDSAIGETIDKIEELGIGDNTYIFYTSDNGTYPTGDVGNINGPLRGHKTTVWEGGVRVPFIVTGPKIRKDSVSRSTIVGYDLFPTICDILGIRDLPQQVEGGSFLSLLETDKTAPVKRPFSFLVFHWPHYQHKNKSKPDTALLQGNYKLHYFYEPKRSMLFDLSQGPKRAIRPFHGPATKNSRSIR